MNHRKSILRDYRESGAFNSLVNVHAAIDNHTFVTKGGDVLSVLKMKGIDYEGRDAAQIDADCRHFESALRLLEDCRIYQYSLKAECAPIPFERYPNLPVLDQAVENRIEFYNSKAAPLSNLDIFLVIVYEGVSLRTRGWRWQRLLSEPLAVLRESFSVASQNGATRKELQQARERLSQKVQSFLVQLEDSARPVLLDKQEAFRFLRRLTNFTPHKATASLKHDSFVDYQVCGSTLECHREYLRFDDHYMKVLTLKEPPTRTFANMLTALAEIDSHYVMASEWKPESIGTVRHHIRSKRRHFHNAKASPLNYLNTTTDSKDILIDDSAAAHIRALGECLEELEVRGNGFGCYSLTIVLYDTDFERLKRSVAECFKIFAAHDAQLIEERYNILNAYLATLPGGRLFNRRQMWLSNANHSDLSFLFKLDEGERTNPHLKAEYLAVLETNHRTPYYLNLHSQDVGHTLVLGATGSGKSFLLNFLLTHAQKYRPRVFVFDLGGSYHTLTQLFGGSYLPIAAASWPFAINPFVLPPTPDNLRFLFLLVLVLAKSSGYCPTAEDEKDLFEQIRNLYSVEPSLRRLSTLVNILNRNLRRELQKWIHPGPYASLFDNVEDTLTFSRFQTFDFEGMVKSPMLEPLLFYILHRANAAVLEESESTVFKVICLDEVWRFLEQPTIREYVREALKTFRKKNAAVILATQSTDDLVQSEMLSVVVESCPTKLFLANPDMSRDQYRSIFHLTETEVELIASLTPKRQFLLKRPYLTKVLNLEVDQKGYWLYTNNPYDNEKKREAFEQHGVREGLNILARSHV
jgi:type IV secretion/conjugal transfer VirB4 family ATPase